MVTETQRSVVRLSPQAIRTLASTTGDPVILSFYLDVDGRRHPRWPDVEKAAQRLARQAEERAARLGVADAVGGDLDALRARLGEGVDRALTRGLALFSCASQGFFSEVRVPRSVRDQVAIDPHPYVGQLEEVLEADVPFVVALADRQHCRILRVHLGEVSEAAGPFDEAPRAVDVDRELGGFARYEEEGLRRHYRRCAKALAGEVDRAPSAQVMISGPGPVAAEIESYLHPSVRRRLAGRLHLPVTARPAEVGAVVLNVQRNLERRAETELVEQLRQLSAADRGGVVGLRPTLEALHDRRIATLVVSRGFEAPGGCCPSCGWVGPGLRLCPRCGERLDDVEDIVELAIDEALGQKAGVVVCDETELDRFGRIGAIERY